MTVMSLKETGWYLVYTEHYGYGFDSKTETVHVRIADEQIVKEVALNEALRRWKEKTKRSLKSFNECGRVISIEFPNSPRLVHISEFLLYPNDQGGNPIKNKEGLLLF